MYQDGVWNKGISECIKMGSGIRSSVYQDGVWNKDISECIKMGLE